MPTENSPPLSAAATLPKEKSPVGGSDSALRTPHSALKWVIVLLPLAYFWFRLINNLRLEWTTNPQYAFGWVVPLLCVGLVLRKWHGLQENGKQKAESRKQKVEIGGQRSDGESQKSVDGFQLSAFSFQLLKSPWSVVILFALLAFLYLPTRLIEAATPEWRPIQWLLGVEAIGLTLCAIWLGKGRGWLRQLAFPVAFFFVAIPWPTLIEAPIIQGLTRASAAVVVELLGWVGVPAMPHGNVIEVATGMVGIDEACSGIRSFQSSLMISLFLGEFYALSRSRRWLLVPVGFGLSMMLNIGRMFLLTLVAAKKGVAAIGQYHDPAGMTIAITCTLALWGLAAWLKRKSVVSSPLSVVRGGQKSVVSGQEAGGRQKLDGLVGKAERDPLDTSPSPLSTLPGHLIRPAATFSPSDAEKGSRGGEEAGGSQKSGVRSPGSGASSELPAVPISKFLISKFLISPKTLSRLSLVLIVWLVVVEAGVLLWFRHLESHLKPGPAWSLNFPRDNATLKDLPISADARYLLRFDEGKQAGWTETDGTKWQVFYCTWLPGRVAGYLAKRHTPEICLQSTGQKMLSGPELTVMNINGVKLPVRNYVFETAGGPLQVFHCRWEAGAESSAYVEQDSARFNLIRGIWAGRGNQGQKVLEIIIAGMNDPVQARAAMVRQLEKMITVSPAGAPNSGSAR
jgi:exosortase